VFIDISIFGVVLRKAHKNQRSVERLNVVRYLPFRRIL